ncbi:unnamed protein product [Protopolystoma xenopodis]|uniref:Small monomeric GTPase n=1 Tax=Protopolystoma xenopodis TaxID=117903 RepID=A0A3S5B7G6_9PLAT|nr:unnamed protein product [Protopolystoma xenopodis]
MLLILFRVAGVPWTLEILDTAGTEQFSSMRDLYIKNGQGFILVYSLTSRQTFHDILGLRDNILRVKGASFTGYPSGRFGSSFNSGSGRRRPGGGSGGLSGTVPLVLVGNKVDLARLGRREVESEDAEALAREWCCPHFETSARDNEGVDDIFVEIVRQASYLPLCIYLFIHYSLILSRIFYCIKCFFLLHICGSLHGVYTALKVILSPQTSVSKTLNTLFFIPSKSHLDPFGVPDRT